MRLIRLSHRRRWASSCHRTISSCSIVQPFNAAGGRRITGRRIPINTGAASGIQGHISSLGHEPHNYTTFYVQVDDVQGYLDKAAALGGKTLVPPVEIPTGTFAWFADLEGNTIGLWKPK